MPGNSTNSTDNHPQNLEICHASRLQCLVPLSCIRTAIPHKQSEAQPSFPYPITSFQPVAALQDCWLIWIVQHKVLASAVCDFERLYKWVAYTAMHENQTKASSRYVTNNQRCTKTAAAHVPSYSVLLELAHHYTSHPQGTSSPGRDPRVHKSLFLEKSKKHRTITKAPPPQALLHRHFTAIHSSEADKAGGCSFLFRTTNILSFSATNLPSCF